MRSSFLIAGLAVAAAVILGLTYYYRLSDQTDAEPEPAPVVETPEPAVDPDPRTSTEVMGETPPSPVIRAPELVLPTLDASDAFVRERLPEDAVPEVWLDKSDLLRRLAVLVENASRGELPRRQLSFLAPDGKFLVREEPGDEPDESQLFMDPAGYRRYDRYLDVLESVPPDTLASLLSDSDPLIQQALGELGANDEARTRMIAAIDQVLAVPVLEGDVELVQPKVFYEYADPTLESLSPLQKQVLRMGPGNVTRLQAYLTTLKAELQRR